MKRRDFLKCSLAVGAGLAASPSTYAFTVSYTHLTLPTIA